MLNVSQCDQCLVNDHSSVAGAKASFGGEHCVQCSQQQASVPAAGALLTCRFALGRQPCKQRRQSGFGRFSAPCRLPNATVVRLCAPMSSLRFDNRVLSCLCAA